MTANFQAAAYWYHRAARKGDARAAFNYGLMLIHGMGIDSDPARGLYWLQAAAAASVQEAYFELGNLYRQGDHVHQDTYAAIDAYRKAAEREHVRAQHTQGNI